MEDCIIIIRSFLLKTKRLLKLVKAYENNKNLEAVIASYKPPIFWKEKDIVKKQVNNWTFQMLVDLISETVEIELTLKKNSYNSIKIISDFVINKSKLTNN